MAASISLAPPARSLHLDAIWLRLYSSLVATQSSYFRLQPTGSNNGGETITFTFGGTSVTFTVAAVPDASGTQIPQRTAQTFEEYANELAGAIAQNETITNTFLVYPIFSNNAWLVLLVAHDRSALTCSHVSTISNMGSVDYSSAGLTVEDNLRALVEVYTDTGSLLTDQSIGQQHAPYDANRVALFDLSSHFADLQPAPPWTGALAAFHIRHEPSMYRRWYFRYADKYGTPAVAEAMQKATGGIVFFGSHSAHALEDYANKAIQHVTTQRDGMLFWKPIGAHQPDWTYFLAPTNSGSYNYLLTVYFDDGTTVTLSPPGWSLPTTGFHTNPGSSLTAGQLYSMTTGPVQLDIAGIEAVYSKTATRYAITITRGSSTQLATRYYEISCDCHGWGLTLLYTNGVGGMDTVWLDGKATELFQSQKEYARRPRTNTWQLADGDTVAFNAGGAPKWKCSTGWHEDANYLDHLRQLPMATKAWIVDTENQRYLPVHIQPGDIRTHEDDEELFALEFDLAAAWIDQNSNL